LAWWVWSLNFGFMDGQQGVDWVVHFFCPPILLAALTVSAHYARKQWFDEPGDPAVASSSEERIKQLCTRRLLEGSRSTNEGR
jgi:hypothetical protein